MNRRRVRALVRKEWQETLRNRTLVLTFGLLLALFTFLPSGLALVIGRFSDASRRTGGLEQFQKGMAVNLPGFERLPQEAKVQVILFRQFHVFFLIVPVIGALGVATYSIIGEKTSRSLEPLLATPITTQELLFAKSLAAALPPAGLTFAAVLVHALLVRLAAGAEVCRMVFDPPAVCLLATGIPLIAFLGLGIGVAVSVRSSDPRSAQQVGAFVVLPLVALFVGQAAGLFILSVPLVLAGAAVLLAADAVVLGIGVGLFGRETILTRWR